MACSEGCGCEGGAVDVVKDEAAATPEQPKALDPKCSDAATRFLGVVALRATLGLRLTNFDCLLVAQMIEELESRHG